MRHTFLLWFPEGKKKRCVVLLPSYGVIAYKKKGS